MCLLGFRWYCSPFWGWNTPKTTIFGCEYAFSSQTGKILKVSCYRNYCIDFNQIWHNDRDHQVVIVGSPSKRSTIAISLHPFDRFWWNLARWRKLTPYSGPTVKISNFWKFQMFLTASFCKQNLLLFIQPRWRLRRTYLFNHYNVLF